MNAAEFLAALWGSPPPAGSYIQIWELATRRSSYMPACYRGFDGQADTFTGVGLAGRRLGAKQRAKANEVVAIAGLWMDIDVGPNACPNRTAALSLANTIAAPTITIDSGHGVHAWWLLQGGPWIFASTQEREAAALMAWQWQCLHRARNGGRLDATHDLARIMRLPGTINAKDPADPRTVTVIESAGPRYTREKLAGICASAPAPAARPAHAGEHEPVDLAGDTTKFTAKLDALQQNSPEFWLAWTHQGRATASSDMSPSAWDLSLCSLAAGAMTDPELVALMHAHRARWSYDRRKLDRADYLRWTITKARSRATRDAASAGLSELARRAA